MSTARVSAELKQATSSDVQVVENVESDEYGFKLSLKLLDGLLLLKEARTFELAASYNGLRAENYIRGWPILTYVVLNDPNILENGKLEVLLKRCADLNVTVHHSRTEGRQGTALHCLLAEGKIDVAIKLVLLAKMKNLKIDAGIRDAMGLTIVHLAAQLRATKFIEHLNEATEAVNAPDAHGRTPLHYAYILADRDLIVALLNAGASDYMQDKNGNTPSEMLGSTLPLDKSWLKEEYNLKANDELIAEIKAGRMKLIFNPIPKQLVDSFSYYSRRI